MADLFEVQRKQKEEEIRHLEAQIEQRKREGKGVTDLTGKIRKLKRELELLSHPEALTSRPEPVQVEEAKPSMGSVQTPPASSQVGLAEAKPKPTKPAPRREVKERTLRVGASDLEYKDYFGLYGSYPLRPLGWAKRNGGFYHLSLGFIPGPAVILHFGNNGRVQITATTQGVDFPEIDFIPSAWLKREGLPEGVKKALLEWEVLIAGLGAEPDLFTAGKATALTRGKFLGESLTMGFPLFQWKEKEAPFGITLIPHPPEGVEVSRVYNPENLPGAPEIGRVIPLGELTKPAPTPLSKLLFTWVKMEQACHQRGLLLRRKPKTPKLTP